MVKTFREIKASKTNKISGKSYSAAEVQTLARNAKVVAKDIVQADEIINKVFAAFDNTSKTFTAEQVRKVRASLSEVKDVVSARLGYCKRAYAKGLRMDLDVTRVANQMEDLSALQAKTEVLQTVADASLDSELMAIDEIGNLVAEEDEEEVPVEEIPEEEAPVEDLPAEDVPDEVVPVEEDAGIPADVPDELSQMEMDDPGMDLVLEDEILEDDMIPLDDGEEPEIGATASLKQRKIASARSVEGTNGAVGGADVLNSIMSEIAR
jgi:uncharacterized protein YaiI (UPF0178 family)